MKSSVLPANNNEQYEEKKIVVSCKNNNNNMEIGKSKLVTATTVDCFGFGSGTFAVQLMQLTFNLRSRCLRSHPFNAMRQNMKLLLGNRNCLYFVLFLLFRIIEIISLNA